MTDDLLTPPSHKYGSNVPFARDALEQLCLKLESGELHDAEAARYIRRTVLPKLYRREPVRKAPARSASMTTELAREIRAYAQRHGQASVQEIADRFRVNLGRVSEVLNGERG